MRHGARRRSGLQNQAFASFPKINSFVRLPVSFGPFRFVERPAAVPRIDPNVPVRAGRDDDFRIVTKYRYVE